jgi:hypothetical protein
MRPFCPSGIDSGNWNSNFIDLSGDMELRTLSGVLLHSTCEIQRNFLDEAGSRIPCRMRTEDACPVRETATLEIDEVHLPGASESNPEMVAWRPYANNDGEVRVLEVWADRGRMTNMDVFEWTVLLWFTVGPASENGGGEPSMYAVDAADAITRSVTAAVAL